MLFRSAVLALLPAFVAANKMDTTGSIPLTSNAGQELLVKATVIEESRHLNNNNNNYDYSWMSGYSIHYDGCTDLVQVAGNGQGGNNKNNENNLLYTQHLVRFSICPPDACSSGCSGGGSYVVSLNTFVDVYTENRLTAFQAQCEAIRENCDCENANDDNACELACYTAANLSACADEEGNDFDAQKYLDCQELKEEGGNNNKNQNNYYYGDNNYYYGQYYVGPYCPDGKSIYLGLFYDQGCSAQADISQYALRMGGAELPYSTTSMVTADDCIACLATDDNNNNNNNNNNNVQIEALCYTSHAAAAKCEESLTITYPDSSACDYVKNILPRLDAASRSNGVTKTTYQKTGRASKAFAFIFAFTTVLFGAYAYFLYRKIKRGVVALASQG